jgi:hypothetical protein
MYKKKKQAHHVRLTFTQRFNNTCNDCNHTFFPLFFFNILLKMTIKSLVANVPSLTKALVSTVLCLSIASYIYIYRLKLDADPDTTPLSISPFIGLLPGL